MTLGFKRGFVVSASYSHDKDVVNLKEHLVLVDTENKEYEFDWIIFDSLELFGEGDKVSFLWDEENQIVLGIRLNPFYKEK